MIAQHAPANPCQGCPRRHEDGCTVALMGLFCPRGVKLVPCDLCERTLPAHQLQGGLCVDCATVLQDETRETPRADPEAVESCDVCPPRCT